MTRRPKPQSINVTLMNQRTRQWTKHRYVDTVECILPMVDDEGLIIGKEPAWEHIFECEVTGLQRRYGTEDRQSSAFDAPAPEGDS